MKKRKTIFLAALIFTVNKVLFASLSKGGFFEDEDVYRANEYAKGRR